jgi:hypothetical protein
VGRSVSSGCWVDSVVCGTDNQLAKHCTASCRELAKPLTEHEYLFKNCDLRIRP